VPGAGKSYTDGVDFERKKNEVNLGDVVECYHAREPGCKLTVVTELA
jgi:hypothetical protein